jgi:hypothetical protein
MKIEMDRKALITLVRGVHPEMFVCDQLVKEGAMRFTGNQHNEDWAWEESWLKRQTDEELLDLYQKYK